MSDEKQAIAQNISLLVSQNRSAEARTELERLIALDPEDPESRSTAGDVYAWTGADGAAYKQYNLAADIFNRLGRADKALGVHHKILDLDTSMMDAATQARVRLLTLLVGAEDALVSGQNERAVAGYQEAIRQFPNHTITYQRLSSLLVRLGRHAEAVEQYLTVGRAFYAHGVLPKARPYFERVLELQADQVEALDAVLACLKAEDKESEGQRFLKSAVQAALEHGNNEAAAAWFERLPEADNAAASPLGSALLLQSGEVGQAERMASQLELSRPEISDWYKRLGRAALDRGDSLSADVYFRWGNGQVELAPPPSAVVAPPPAEATPVPVQEAVPVLAAPAPPPVVQAPPPVAAPAPLQAPPLPPPGLAPPIPPMPPAAPVLAAPLAPPPGLGQPAAPPPILAAVAAAPAPEGQDDKAILQTMGEMCLAEEMFEEAKQVFERLTRADPGRAQYWELLNRARAGLGLHAVEASVPASAPAPVAAAPLTPPPLAAPAPAVLAPAPPAALALAPPAPLPPVTVAPAPLAPPPLAPATPPLAAPSPAPAPLAPPLAVEAVASAAPPAPNPVEAAPVLAAPAPEVLAPPPLAPPAAAAPPSLPPLPVFAAPPALPTPPPLPLFAAAEAAAAPEAEAEAPARPQRPEIEPMGRRGHGTIGEHGGHVERPSVEWGDSPYAVGPEGAKVAEPHHEAVPQAEPIAAVAAELAAPAPAAPIQAPPVLAPPPVPALPPLPVPAAVAPQSPAQIERAQRGGFRREAKIPELAAAVAGPMKITRTAFTVQLGELPPAVPSAVDLQDEIIE